MKKFRINLRMFFWMTTLTGIIYPLFITLLAQLFMKEKADGSFISSKGKIVGSAFISQKFESEKYFWSRPSAVDYNPLPSGGSNLGPTSTALKKAVDERREKILKSHSKSKKEQIPAELLFASGSGLDPHISVSCAYFQTDRVAKARGLAEEKIKQLINEQAIARPLGFLGEVCINVLRLNLALDEQESTLKEEENI